MYASNYGGEHGGISVPDGYGGTMLHSEEAPIEEVRELSEQHTEEKSESVGSFSGIFGGGLGNMLGRAGILRDFKLGGEEILIIGAALFLLFSGSGDIECLIILLVLLFIK